MMRHALPLVCVFALIPSLPRTARAAPPSHGAEAFAGVSVDGSRRDYMEPWFAIGWRWRAFAFDFVFAKPSADYVFPAVLSYRTLNGESASQMRFGNALRWDFHRGRWSRAFVEAEYGLSRMRVDGFVAQPLANGFVRIPEHHVTVDPYVGGALGAAFHPWEYVSLGFKVGGRVSAERQTMPQFPYVGLVLGVHVPLFDYRT